MWGKSMVAKSSLLRLLRTRRGAAAVGYGLLVGLIGVAILGAVGATGTSLSALLGMTANRLQGEAPPPVNEPNEPGPAPAPQLAFSPASVGGMDVLSSGIPTFSDAVTVTLANTGTATAQGVSPAVSGSAGTWQIQSHTCPSQLAANASCAIVIRVGASANGALAGSLSAGSGSATAALSGAATGFDGTLILDSEALEVAAVTAATGLPGACTPVTVTNSGWGPVPQPQGALSGPDAAAFALCTPEDDACADVLPATESCALGVRLAAPAGDGAFAATLTVTAGSLSASRELSGNASGLDPFLLLDAGVLTIAGITDGSSEGACTDFPVRNIGLNPGLANAQAVLPEGSSFVACTPGGTACSSAPIPGQGSCNLGFRLSGVVYAGSYGEAVSVTADGADPASRQISATVTGSYAPAIALGSGTLSVAAASGGSATGACTVLPVTNSGNAPGLADVTLSFSGADAGKFAACAPTGPVCGNTLAPGASCNWGVRLNNLTANGTFTATVEASASGAASVSRAVEGTSSGFAPALSVAADLTVAGVNGTTTGACTALTLTNNGTMAGLANAQTVSISPATFFESCAPGGNACSSAAVPVGGSCNLGYRLRGIAAAGSVQATATISADGVASRSVTLNGTATGTYAPVIALGGTSTFTVSAISTGVSSGTCTALTVTNTGNIAGLADLSFAFDGANPGAFATCNAGGTLCGGAAVAAGGTCTVGVRLNAIGANGTYTANLRASSASAATVSRPVSGSASGFATMPSGLSLSHTANTSSFTAAWTAGSGISSCQIQNFNGSSWVGIASVNCATNTSGAAFTLSDVGSNWNGRGVRLLVNGTTAVSFPQTLTCTARAGSGSPTPTIDENCNGVWDDSASGGTVAGCPSGQSCVYGGWGGPAGNYQPPRVVYDNACIPNSLYYDFYGASCAYGTGYYTCSDGYNDCFCGPGSGCTHTASTTYN